MGRHLSIGLVCALAACASPARRAPPPVVSATAAELLATVRAREAQLYSLRAHFTVVAEHADEHQQLNGVIVAARPDRARMRLMLPLGLTVFDYLRVGRDAWVARPLGPAEAPDGPSSALPLSAIALPLVSDPAGCAADCSRADPDPIGFWVRCYCVDPAQPDRLFPARFLLIRSADAAIVEERRFAQGHPSATIRSNDYRLTDGVLLPFRLTMSYAGDARLSVTVAIDRYDVNPPLADELFLPAPDSRPVPLPAS